MPMPTYMRRYTMRLLAFMALYAVTLIGGQSVMRGPNPPGSSVAVALALAAALPICGVFWAIYRLLVECDDEYERLLFAKQTLFATFATLTAVTVWQFLLVFDVLLTPVQWVAAIWFAMLGVGGAVVRRRA